MSDSNAQTDVGDMSDEEFHDYMIGIADEPGPCEILQPLMRDLFARELARALQSTVAAVE